MTAIRTIERGGPYYRVASPNWLDASDISYSKQRGGRWNAAGEFGALYLNAALEVAAANARAQHAGRAIKLFDLKPEARPELVIFKVKPAFFLDACTSTGVKALGFARNFPFGVDWAPCQLAGRAAHAKGLPGVASRSAAEVTSLAFIGEELALFDQSLAGKPRSRLAFGDWYPHPIP